MTRCLYCNSRLRWSSDNCFSDYGMEEDGLKANLSCPQCNSFVEFWSESEDVLGMINIVDTESIDNPHIRCWLCGEQDMEYLGKCTFQDFGLDNEGEISYLGCQNENCNATGIFYTNMDKEFEG